MHPVQKVQIGLCSKRLAQSAGCKAQSECMFRYSALLVIIKCCNISIWQISIEGLSYSHMLEQVMMQLLYVAYLETCSVAPVQCEPGKGE